MWQTEPNLCKHGVGCVYALSCCSMIKGMKRSPFEEQKKNKNIQSMNPVLLGRSDQGVIQSDGGRSSLPDHSKAIHVPFVMVLESDPRCTTSQSTPSITEGSVLIEELVTMSMTCQVVQAKRFSLPLVASWRKRYVNKGPWYQRKISYLPSFALVVSWSMVPIPLSIHHPLKCWRDNSTIMPIGNRIWPIPQRSSISWESTDPSHIDYFAFCSRHSAPRRRRRRTPDSRWQTVGGMFSWRNTRKSSSPRSTTFTNRKPGCDSVMYHSPWN